jgi:hypothetical protein
VISISKDILESLVAPGITTFTSADIPDVEGRHPEASYWPVNYFLNSGFGHRFVHGARQVVLA